MRLSTYRLLIPMAITCSRWLTVAMFAGRRLALVLTHSMTKLDRLSGTSGLRSRGLLMNVSTRKLLSPFSSVKSVGMRWPHEVDRNVELLENFVPPIDFAELPRMTADVYKAEDSE